MTPGSEFGRYRLLKQIASGGMGELWVALMNGPDGFQKTVALKTILPHLAKDRHFLDMFIDEARLCARLSHPNICQVFELGQVDDTYYLAMEHLRGLDLVGLQRATFERERPIPVALLVRIIADAAAGLEFAHSFADGLVHRDVSPHNIFVTYDGAVKVIDFGIAKARGRISTTESGMIKGKYAYMSPEQTLGLELDRRSDVFALGIVLHELLSRQPLFRSDSPLVTVERVREAHVAPPSVINPASPASLDAIVLKALARDRESRWSSAHELRMALEDWLTNEHTNASSAHVVKFLRQAEVEQFQSVGKVVDDTPELSAVRADLPDIAAFKYQPNPDDVHTTASGRIKGGGEVVAGTPPAEPAKKQTLTAAAAAIVLFAVIVAAIVWPRPRPVDRSVLDATFGPGLAAPLPCRVRDADVARVQAALGTVDALLAQHVDAAEYSALLARAALDGERYDLAWAAARDAGAACPQWAMPYHLQGKAAQATDKLDNAEAAYIEAIKAAPVWEAPKFNLGLVLIAKNKPNDAIRQLDKVLETSPSYPRAHLVRGQAYLLAKKPAEAAKDLKQALAENPNDEVAKKLLAAATASSF